MYYQHFTTTDLYNWKHNNLPYLEKPQAMIDLVESPIQTHNPTWEDCQQFLQTFFNMEEKRHILAGTHQYLEMSQWEWQTLPHGYGPQFWRNKQHRTLPLKKEEDTYVDIKGPFLLQGIQAKARKPINMTKLSSVSQGPKESPGDFYERLCKAYRIYAPFDPEAPDSQKMVNTSFIAQACPDIRKKLQKPKAFAEINISHLPEIADKVYNNQEAISEKKANKRIKEKANPQASILAATLQDRGVTTTQCPNPWKQPNRDPKGERPQHPLNKDQCAYCKKRNIRKMNTPTREGKRSLPNIEKNHELKIA
jgi:hypothetical protein